MAEKKLIVGVKWEDYTAVHFGNKLASSLRLLNKNRELAVVGPSARGSHLDPEYKQGVWAEGHLIQGQAGPFKDITEAKTYVEQVFGLTPDRTAELEEELALARDNLDIIYAHGVAKGKELGRKEVRVELAAFKNKAKKTVQEAAELVKELRDELKRVDTDRNHLSSALDLLRKIPFGAILVRHCPPDKIEKCRTKILRINCNNCLIDEALTKAKAKG